MPDQGKSAALMKSEEEFPIGCECRVLPAQGSAQAYIGELLRLHEDHAGVVRADILMKPSLNRNQLDILVEYMENDVPLSQFTKWRDPNPI